MPKKSAKSQVDSKTQNTDEMEELENVPLIKCLTLSVGYVVGIKNVQSDLKYF